MAQLTAAIQGVQWAGLASAFIQVVLIDLTLAGDNAVAVGMAAAGLPPAKRRMAIILGLAGAVAMLSGLALIATQLLKVVGLLFAGGVLLLWVSWHMWRDLRARRHSAADTAHAVEAARHKTLGRALTQILIADVSMSLDNVLAVAGAARDHKEVLIPGLLLSIGLTGFAATWVARLLHRWPWIGYVGLAIVLFVALHMMWDGARQIPAVRAALGG
jgi:YjbE family integral membrane protein